MLGLFGNRTSHTAESYRDSGEARCAKSLQQAPHPFSRYCRNFFPLSEDGLRANDRVSLAFALCCCSALRSWMGTRPACPCVSPRKPEGNRTRRWRMAGTPDQRMPMVAQLVKVADGHAGSGSVSSRAQRRRASDVTCSIRYRNGLVHRPAAPSARALESVCSALTLEKNLRLTRVSHR